MKMLTLLLAASWVQMCETCNAKPQVVADLAVSGDALAQSMLPTASSDQDNSTANACETSTEGGIVIACSFPAASPVKPNSVDAARIRLNQAKFSFGLTRESRMQVELDFTNEGTARLSPSPVVYLAFTNEAGQNVLRRALPHVDLSKIEPGRHLTLTDSFLVGAFSGGRYAISLSISSPDPALQNDSASNVLLSNPGVGDRKTGLNTIGYFTVKKSIHSSHDK